MISSRCRHKIGHPGDYAAAVPAPHEPSSDPDRTPPRGLDDLYDIARLADRLGVEHATIRVWLSRKVPWLPAPDGRLNGGAVWRATTLEGLEDRRRPGRPGPKPRYRSAPAAADVARTGPLPVVSQDLIRTGPIPLVPAPDTRPVERPRGATEP